MVQEWQESQEARDLDFCIHADVCSFALQQDSMVPPIESSCSRGQKQLDKKPETVEQLTAASPVGCRINRRQTRVAQGSKHQFKGHVHTSVGFPAQPDYAAGRASIIAMADAGAGGWGQSSRYLLLFAAGTAVGSAIALGAAYGFSSALAAARADGGDAGASRREGRSARCGPAHLLLAHRAQQQHRTDDDAFDFTRQQCMLRLMAASAWVEGAMQARRGCQTLVPACTPLPPASRHGTHKQGDRSSHEGYGRPSKVRTIHWVWGDHRGIRPTA